MTASNVRRLISAAVALMAAALFSHAQEIRDISTTVNLFRTGNAQVIQKWDVTVTSGTEWYIPIDNPGKSYIHDFHVFENGNEYANEGRKWNSDRSLEAKTRRCGIVEKSGGNIELCWGQGQYGDHVYTISYIIDNLVLSYPECDGFHWHFLNDEWQTRPRHASIRIVNMTDADPWYWEKADSCNVRYWGFGMVGESWLDNNAICFESTEPFKYSSNFSALVSFDKGLFLPAKQGDGTFEELKDEAFKGSDYGEEKKTFWDYVALALVAFVFIGLPVIFVLSIVWYVIKRIWRRTSGNRYRKEVFGKTKIDSWSRDVPFDANPTVIYSLLQSGDYLCRKKTTAYTDVISAYFLKWIQDGIIRTEPDPKSEKRVNLRFVKLSNPPQFTDKMESAVYAAAVKAAGDDLLEADEFKKWSYSNDGEVASWPNEAIYCNRPVWQAASMEERCRAVEFKNYLEDFTIIDERSAPEVGVWKKYMIVAAAFGIADKVAKNFEKLYPKIFEEYVQQSNMLDTATTYYILNSLNRSSASMMSAAVNRQAEREAARAAQQRRSSGGGGGISFGGGGGGFGGGHGGGSR